MARYRVLVGHHEDEDANGKRVLHLQGTVFDSKYDLLKFNEQSVKFEKLPDDYPLGNPQQQQETAEEATYNEMTVEQLVAFAASEGVNLDSALKIKDTAKKKAAIIEALKSFAATA